MLKPTLQVQTVGEPIPSNSSAFLRALLDRLIQLKDEN